MIEPFEIGSGNVFADLGFPPVEAQEEMAKVRLAVAIGDAVKARGLTQAAAAKLTGESQPNISMMIGGKLTNFSRGRLEIVLLALGNDVEIIVRPAPRDQERGRLTVVAGT